jgi:hypothetical protein
MTDILKPRNWVAKHNRHRAVRQRVRTRYQRHAKHRKDSRGAE